MEGVQAYVVLNTIAADRSASQLAPNVVIHLGNNGVINPSQLTEVLAQLSDRRRIIVVNDHVPRDWQTSNNLTIRDVTSRFQNVTLIDWNAIADANPSWFYSDGLHLSRAGATAYAQLVLRTANGMGH